MGIGTAGIETGDQVEEEQMEVTGLASGMVELMEMQGKVVV